jgi:hypothetical protein
MMSRYYVRNIDNKYATKTSHGWQWCSEPTTQSVLDQDQFMEIMGIISRTDFVDYDVVTVERC